MIYFHGNYKRAKEREENDRELAKFRKEHDAVLSHLRLSEFSSRGNRDRNELFTDSIQSNDIDIIINVTDSINDANVSISEKEKIIIGYVIKRYIYKYYDKLIESIDIYVTLFSTNITSYKSIYDGDVEALDNITNTIYNDVISNITHGIIITPPSPTITLNDESTQRRHQNYR